MQSDDDQTEENNAYVVDTSSLIDAKLWYERVNGFWSFLGSLIDHKRVIIPAAVKSEVDDGDDWLKNFLNRYRHKIIDPNKEIQEIINDIDNDYNGYYSMNQKDYADVHVVATALYYKEYYKKNPRLGTGEVEVYVITEESLASEENNHKPRIPNVCKKYGIKYEKIRNILKLETKIL